MEKNNYSRKQFLQTTGAVAAGTLFASPMLSFAKKVNGAKTKLALVGTGVRGVAMYGRDLLRNYGDYVELVGLCDTNPGRLAYASEYIGAGCPVFTDLEQMLALPLVTDTYICNRFIIVKKINI